MGAGLWKSTSASGAPDNSSLSHFSAMTRPSWLGRAVRNRHRHAIEQASRRWRGGRRDDSARTRRTTQVGNKDMFGAAFSEAPDVAPALTGQEDAEELAQRAERRQRSKLWRRRQPSPRRRRSANNRRTTAAGACCRGSTATRRARCRALRSHADAPVVPGGLLRRRFTSTPGVERRLPFTKTALREPAGRRLRHEAQGPLGAAAAQTPRRRRRPRPRACSAGPASSSTTSRRRRRTRASTSCGAAASPLNLNRRRRRSSSTTPWAV